MLVHGACGARPAAPPDVSDNGIGASTLFGQPRLAVSHHCAARNRLLRLPTDPARGPAEVDCMNFWRVERSFDDMTRPASGTKVLLYHRHRRTTAFTRAPAPVPRRQPATLNPFAGTVRALFGPRQDSQTPLLPIDSTAGRAFRSGPSSARPCGYPAPGSAYLPFAYRSFLGLRSSAINLLPGISTNL